MEKKDAIVSITYIISGALLQMFNGVQDGFGATLISIFGFIVFFMGLSKLKNLVDEIGQKAIGLLMIAALIGAGGAVIDLIPLMGLIASIAYLAAFIMELIGLSQLKSSRTFGPEGKSGFSILTLAMVLSIVRAVIGVIPFIGGIFASIISVAVVVLVLVGWMKVQEDMAERFVTG